MTIALSLPQNGQARKNRSAIPQNGALSPLAETRLRRRLRQIAPSEPWVDAQIVTRDEPAPDGRLVARRYFATGVFPPGGRSRTAMRYCRQCGRYTPPQALLLIEHFPAGIFRSATLVCDDCHIAREVDRHQELHDAFPHLRPQGSISFLAMADLFSARRTAR